MSLCASASLWFNTFEGGPWHSPVDDDHHPDRPKSSQAGHLAGIGGDAGVMLYIAGTTSTSNYAQAATHFLQDAANGAPTYQTPLIGTYVASSTPHLS